MNKKKFCWRFLALLYFAFIFSNAVQAEESSASSSSGGLGQQFEGFNLSGYTDSGEKSWDVKGDTAIFMGTMIEMTNIVAHAYGTQKMDLTAKTGTVDQKNGNMHLEKDVVMTSDTGAKLTTNSLDWERDKDVVTTQDQVVLVDDKMRATGTGALAHPNLKTAQMNEDVEVKIKTPANKDPKATEKTVIITCDGPMEIDQAKQQAIFNNNVVAYQEGKEMKADRMEVYFDQQSKQVKEMVCIGHVAITMNGNTTYSEKAVYRQADQKMVLSGRPKLILMTEGEKGFGSFGN